MTRITVDEWQQALQEAAGSRVDSVPKNWITMDQFAARLNMAITSARRNMKLLVDAGKAETKPFRVQTGTRILPVPHYRLKK